MLTKNTYMLIGALVALAIGVYAYGAFVEKDATQERTGTEQLTAEQVVDLEVQAEAEYEANGGTY